MAGPLEPAAKRQLSRIESNGRHLLTIINEILDISRIEADLGWRPRFNLARGIEAYIRDLPNEAALGVG